jgi:hypothetical protein
MEKIAEEAEREFYIRAMQPDETLGDPFDGQIYAALVWATRSTTAARKHRLCAALIASGCRYVVCGGRESVAWEEAVDEAFVAQDLSETEFQERLVMTSSHEREPMREVVFFFTIFTNLGPHDYKRYLVLMIGDDARIQGELVSTLQAHLNLSS